MVPLPSPDEVLGYPNHYVCHFCCTMQQEDPKADPSLSSDHIWGPDDSDMSEAKRSDENVLRMSIG
ncbi:uncharacterized protein ARMOST_13621 [Armillaria ostoyae]|uniref:Uncharacterized protein n=1 Tax=Armillaria ostoyae TaxID=47428 RepID=A0A284RNA4_ARMOS|nr:uncharacterized protein ARMOST_13621 [Armillaria ostoyae]